MKQKVCPHCGNPLHESASCCPYCVSSVNSRSGITPPPRRAPRYLLPSLLGILALCALLLGGWLHMRPKTYNGMGEVIYRDGGATYQLCIAWADTPFTPFSDRYCNSELNYDYRYPVLLYVNHVESDTHAGETFMQKVDSITAEFSNASDALHISCTEPAPDASYIPDAACITFVDHNISEHGIYTAELTITLNMKNGDVIHVRQNHHFETIHTYNYTPQDAPMGNIEELQALVNQICNTVEEDAAVNIYLPPVTYQGGLVLEGRGVNFYGSEDGRTAFTDTVRVGMNNSWISSFENIDFFGNNNSVGISAAARVHLIGCHVTGWKTGVLGYGNAWVWMSDCEFTDNETGFHFNSTGSNVSNIHYRNNTFENNGTAILLERVPTDMEITFEGSRFTGNRTDIDNRCQHPIDISEAVFQ